MNVPVAATSAILLLGTLIVDTLLLHRQRVDADLLINSGVSGSLFADFDSDGNPDHLFVRTPDSGGQTLVVLGHDGHQLLEIPFGITDNSLRTHVAVNKSVTYEHVYPWKGTKTYRLIVLQPTPELDLRQEVYEYRSGRLQLTQANTSDRRMIEAMRTEDEQGTYELWGLYSAGRLPILLVLASLALVVTRMTAQPAR